MRANISSSRSSHPFSSALPSSIRRSRRLVRFAILSNTKESGPRRSRDVCVVAGIGSLLVLSGIFVLYAMQAAGATSLPAHLQPVHYVDLAQDYRLGADSSASKVSSAIELHPALSETPGDTSKAAETSSSAYALPEEKEKR